MKIYLNSNFEETDEASAVLIKVIPEDGSPPYFIFPAKEEKAKDEEVRAGE